MSSSPSVGGEGLPSSGRRGRTPLRSLRNDNCSTPLLWQKSKTVNAVYGNLKNDQENLQNSPTQSKSLSDEITFEHGDVTLKSFLCDGGEVEISESPTSTEEKSIILPRDQHSSIVQEMQSFVSDNMMENSFGSHTEHPYFNPIPATEKDKDYGVHQNSSDLDDIQTTKEDDEIQGENHEERHIIWKSFSCNGGEVEIFDSPTECEETLPSPVFLQTETHQDDSVIEGSECPESTLPQHDDHQYCLREPQIPSPLSNGSSNECEEPGNRSEVELKCMEAEVIISRSQIWSDTIMYDQIATNGDATSAEESLLCDDVHSITRRLDLENNEDNKVTSISLVQETCSSGGEEEQEHGDCKPLNDSKIHQKPPAVPELCPPGEEKPVDICTVGLHMQDDGISTPPQHDPKVRTSLRTLVQETSVLNVREHLQEMVPVVSPTDIQTGVSDCGRPQSSDLQEQPEGLSLVLSSRDQSPSTETKDSAFGSSENVPNLCPIDENRLAETLPDVLRIFSECPSMASVLQLGILSPVVRRHSLAEAYKGQGPALAHNVALMEASALWAEHLECTMSPPLFNSTTVGCKPQLCADQGENASSSPNMAPEVNNADLETPLIQQGPLQQQLRQMAEFLLLTSGKIGFAPAVKSAETQSMCVGTSPVNMVDCSLNTSGQFVRTREFSVADACTMTNPLLWNVSPDSMEALPKHELEQRLRSSMIMVEALVQQLSVARAKRVSVGPPPSELREKLVQTDHTELSQTSMYRDLYTTAVKQIQDLELDGSSLRNLVCGIQDMQVDMESLSSDLNCGLSNMKQMEELIREDHQSLVSHYCAMASLLKRSKETQGRMMEKVKDALEQRDDMRTRMEEAFTAREAAYSVVDQLRSHSAGEIEELQRSLGSQKELLAALNRTCPEQVTLSQACTGTLDSASDLLHQTYEEQSRLIQELCEAKKHLHKMTPILLNLKEKAAAAVRDVDEHLSAKARAVEEKEQVEDELTRTRQSLESARDEVGDLNLQVTILNSEMGILRQKLSEQEKDQALLETRITEMSATVSSTEAAHTFLKHALADETAKSLEAQNDLRLSCERAEASESSLSESERRNDALNHALADAGERLHQLQELAQFQKDQIQQLQEVCTKLDNVQEMNEFLQMENDSVREQMSESEDLLKKNLQGLRERNIQCEDLKVQLSQLKAENTSLLEDLENTRLRANGTRLQLEDKLAQAATEVTLLHHTLRGVTDELHAALSDESQEDGSAAASGSVGDERRNLCSSFVDDVMIAMTTKSQEDDQLAGPDPASLFSVASAFTRIPVIVTQSAASPPEDEPAPEESSVADLLADLCDTVSELVGAMKRVQEMKSARLEQLQNDICDLHVELKSTNNRHESEVSELKHQLSRMSFQLERGIQAVEQKAQNEKLMFKLTSEVTELQDDANKHLKDNKELRKSVMALERSLQQSQAEARLLRSEVKKDGGQFANTPGAIEEKILLLNEVTRLKTNLQEAEQAKVKLLERAKRHQIIHQTNQEKSEKELYMLSKMISKVRETLLSLPHELQTCEQLQQLVTYIG